MAKDIEADPVAVDADTKKHEKRLNTLLELVADTGDKSLLGKVPRSKARSRPCASSARSGRSVKACGRSSSPSTRTI